MAVHASMQTKMTFYEDPTRAKWTRGTYGTAIHERSKNVEAAKFEFIKPGKRLECFLEPYRLLAGGDFIEHFAPQTLLF